MPDLEKSRPEELQEPSPRSILQDFPPIEKPKPDSYLEWSGLRHMTLLLFVICIVILGFVGGWALTWPTIADAKAIGATSDNPEMLMEILTQLRAEHNESFRDMFQLFVLSGLVPLFTLLAGYVFGKGQAQRAEADEE